MTDRVDFWNDVFKRFGALASSGTLREARGRLLEIVRGRLAQYPEEDAWFRTALQREEGKNFVALFFTHLQWMPESLYDPMIRAAVEEVDPSRNRLFVRASLATFGRRRVYESLLQVFEVGDTFEKAGAANALYWVHATAMCQRNQPDIDPAAFVSTPAAGAVADLQAREDSLMLREFVRNPDVDVRRAIVGRLRLDATLYDEEARPLVGEAIRIARDHDDEYIRHRVEVQLGNVSLYEPRPPRSPRPR